MDLNLKDKVALVTGGSRGIGTAICLALAAEGAKVVVNYNTNGEMAEEVVKKIKSEYGTDAMAVGANVANESDVLDMYAKVIEKFSQVDILVNNAAVCPVGPVREMALETWQQAMDVNLNGTFLCSREFVKLQVDKGLKGRLVNIVSQAAFRGSASGKTPYDASKGGIVTFTVALAREMAPHGVAVNAVAPGLVMTDMVAGLIKKDPEKYLNRVPLHRIAEPKEIADVVLFLASERSSYMTGATVDVTGGMLLR
ncbi:MAG: 3-oxoacyl-ACP reductase FabG [Planctomycetes bacterium]|nr:3-oxoacyl-ACP reductase FabG [Planctomycetota bacterium]